MGAGSLVSVGDVTGQPGGALSPPPLWSFLPHVGVSVWGVSSYYAVANDWVDGMFYLTIYRGEQVVFGDLVDADQPTEVTAVARARLTRAGWHLVGDWQADGAGWRATVEPVEG